MHLFSLYLHAADRKNAQIYLDYSTVRPMAELQLQDWWLNSMLVQSSYSRIMCKLQHVENEG
jgi:hypothetical protein